MPIKVLSMAQIDLFKYHSYSTVHCTKKDSKETIKQNCKRERTMNEIPYPLHVK